MTQTTCWPRIARVEFEAAFLERQLPLVRIDERYWQQELHCLERLRW